MNEKAYNKKQQCFYVIFTIATVLFLVYLFFFNTDRSNWNDVNDLQIQGSYLNDTDELVPFNEYSDINYNRKRLTIEGDFSREIPYNTQIMFYLYRLDVELYINDELVYQSEPTNDSRWEFYSSKGIKKNDNVKMVLSAYKSDSNSYELLLSHLKCGSKYSLMHMQIRHNLVKIVIGLIILVIGISILITTCVMKFFKVPIEDGYMSCGLLMIAGSVCTLIDYEYITLIFPCVKTINMIDYLSQFLIIEFLLIYLKKYLYIRQYRKVMDLYIVVWSVLILSNYVLYLAGLYIIIEITNIMALFAIIFFVTTICFLVKDYRASNDLGIRNVFLSGIVLLLMTFIEMFHYLIAHYFFIWVFQLGLLVFTMVQFLVMMNRTKNNMKAAAKIQLMQAENARQKIRTKELENELMRNQMAVMLSQVKPHFIYNTLGTIAALCTRKPERAKEMTKRFSRYLRANMDSLDKGGCIPFKKELEHVKNYLYIEQIRFEDKLEVEWNIQIQDFECPPLVLQTIVENAVKHGICGRAGKGVVTINTIDGEDDYVISVEDNGIGFDVDQLPQDDRSHIGIINTQERLNILCNGTLQIKSEIGKGTKCKIRIPKEKE